VASATCKTPRLDTHAASAKALHDHIVARTCRLADAMLRMSSRHIRERWNLRNTDLRLLNILDGKRPLTVNEISRRALLDQAWVSRSLRALEAGKLVERRSDPGDSRLTLVTLTRRGREIIEESRPYAEWSERVLLQGVDEKALKALLDQLEANAQGLIDQLEAHPAKLPKRGRREGTPAWRGGEMS
jgi:DNA-binding MarR family transcriptional regulator